MASAPDPKYDLAGALSNLLPGIVVQRQLLDAAAAAYAENGYQPLTEAEAVACMTAANELDLPDMATTPLTNVLATAPTPGTYPPALPAPIALDGDATFAGQVGDIEPEIIGNLVRLPDSNPSPKLGLNSGTSGDPRVVGG